MSKLIENKTTSIKLTEDTFVKYADLLSTIINKPVKEAIDLKSMRRDLEYLKKFEDAKETIELTDSEYDYIAAEVAKSQWAIKHLDILDFADYIESLK